MLLHGLSNRGGFRSQSDLPFVHGEILVNFRKEVVTEASMNLAKESEPTATIDRAERMVEQIKSPGLKEVDGRQTSPTKNGLDERYESIQKDGVIGPNEQSGEIGCMGQKEENIPDVGQSNRVGRRKQMAPCELG